MGVVGCVGGRRALIDRGVERAIGPRRGRRVVAFFLGVPRVVAPVRRRRVERGVERWHIRGGAALRIAAVRGRAVGASDGCERWQQQRRHPTAPGNPRTGRGRRAHWLPAGTNARGTLASTHPPWGAGYACALRKTFAAQLATPGEPMSFAATALEHMLPVGPIRTATVTCPLSVESCASP